MARIDTSPFLTSHDTGQQLDKGPLLIGDLIGQEEYPSVNINFGHPYEFGKSTWIEIRCSQCIAYRVMAAETIVTGIAGYVVRYKDAIAGFIVRNICSN